MGPRRVMGVGLCAPALAGVAWAQESQGGAGAPPLDLGGSLITMLWGLGLVLALMFLLVWLVKKSGMARLGGGQGPLKLEARLPLGPRTWVCLVRVESQRVLLGVTENSVNLLATLEDGAPPARRASEPAGFANALADAAGRRDGEGS